MLKLSILLICFASLSFGYDFKDSAFNEYLVDELRDAGSLAQPAFRFKRDTENEICNSPQRGMYCCKSDKIDPAKFELVKKVKMECYKEIKGDQGFNIDPFDCEAAQNLKQKMICMGECFAKKMDVLTDNGELHRDKIVEHLKQEYAEDSWKLEKIEDIVDKCLAEVHASSAEESECNSQPLKLIHCTFKEFVQNCPKDLQVDSMKCNKLREKIASNDEGYLRTAQFHRIVQMFQREQ